jgi:hypothetical protein
MYNPEHPNISDFPLERARVHHLDAALRNLKSAYEHTPPDEAPAVTYFQTPAEIATIHEAGTSMTPDEIRAIREQINKEAA